MAKWDGLKIQGLVHTWVQIPSLLLKDTLQQIYDSKIKGNLDVEGLADIVITRSNVKGTINCNNNLIMSDSRADIVNLNGKQSIISNSYVATLNNNEGEVEE